MQPWWNEQQAALIGAIGGSAFGIFGAVFGTVAGIFAPRGRLKRTVYAMTGVLVGVGICGLVFAGVALASGQPYAVWYPLVLVGGISAVLGCVFTPLVRIRYREAENRRMEAEQLRRG
jgi:NO-binding membrane sensor protein with MHYT domain